MLVLEKNSLAEEIALLIEQYGAQRESLLPILEAVQAKYHYVSEFAQQEIARHLNIHPVEVYSVVTFYAFLKDAPQGRNTVRVCRTIACDMAGKEEVCHAISRELGVHFGETTTDNRIHLSYTNCLGMCDQGPAMLVNDKLYTRLNPEKAVKILESVK